MKSVIPIPIILLLTTAANGNGISASLKVAEVQGLYSRAYRQAELTIKNSTDKTIETVLLKPSDIGMKIRYDFVIPPRAIGKRFVLLPATAPVQEYLISALSAPAYLPHLSASQRQVEVSKDKTSEKIGQCFCSITWPTKLIATDEFIDKSYEPFFDDVTKWPIKTKRNYALILLIYTLFATGALLIRRGKFRLAMLIVIISSGIVLMTLLVSSKANKLVVHHYQLRIFNKDGTVLSECFNVISSLKTQGYTFRDNFLAHPVWQSASEARDDDVLFLGDNKTLHMTVTPGKARIIKASLCPIDEWDEHPSESADKYKSSSTHFVNRQIRKEGNYYIIESEYLTEEMALLYNDLAWFIKPERQGNRTAKVKITSAVPQSIFIQRLINRNDNRLAGRIFSYWRWKYQQANKYYLVKIRTRQNKVYMEVFSFKNLSVNKDKSAKASEIESME